MKKKQYDSYAEKLANSGYTVLPTEEYLELRDQLAALRRWTIVWKQVAKVNREWRIRNLHIIWDTQAEKNGEELRANRAEEKANKLPFYWIRPVGYPAEQCADEGWYQWTERGLVYLGVTADIAKAAEAENERLHDVLQRIQSWIDAYSLSVFPEPDFVRARELLEAGDMTLDAVSASNMRHVLNGIKDIINADYGDAGIND